MKKLTTLAALFLISTVISLSSCGKNSAALANILQAYYLGALHTYNSANGMYVYQASMYSTASGVESGTNNTLTYSYSGTNTGNYPLGPSYTNSLSLTLGSKTYSSNYTGSYGSINITKLDNGSMWATGNFSGTLYSSTPGDSLPVTQGVLNLKYQF